jgi:hypothetical protein
VAGLWLGLGYGGIVGWPRFDPGLGPFRFFVFFSCFALGQDRICVSFTLLHFGPVLGVFLCLTCKTSEFSETREMVSLKTPIYIVFGES